MGEPTPEIQVPKTRISAPAPVAKFGTVSEIQSLNQDNQSLQLQRQSMPSRRRNNNHGLHVKAGIVIVPSILLNQFFRSYTNSVCREEAGSYASDRGTNRVGGCNYHVGAGYRWQRKKVSMQVSLGYTKLHMPDGNWLSKGETLAAADYTQINLNLYSATFGLFRDFEVARISKRLRFDWRLGGELGAALVGGSIMRTPLGSQSSDCTLDGLGQLENCRPYRPLEFNESNRDSMYFADCDNENGCRESDLIRAGRQKETQLPGILPTARLYTGPRIRWNDRIGVAFEAGAGMGLTFGLGVDVNWR